MGLSVAMLRSRFAPIATAALSGRSRLMEPSTKYKSSIFTGGRKTGTLQLATCSTIDAPVFDPVAAGGVFAFFFLGVAGTWYLSQNLGLILEAVKKW